MTEQIAAIRTELNAPFFDAAARGELLLPHGIMTGRAFWPPSPLCPYDDGGVEWRPVDPVGVVISQAVYRRPFLKVLSPLMPYGIALVELDCGPRLQVHVTHPDASDRIVAGQRVRIGFRELAEGAGAVPCVAGPA